MKSAHPSRWVRYLPFAVGTVTLAVFAGAIILVLMHLRVGIREQIIRRDGDVLNAAALIDRTVDDPIESTGLVDESALDQLATILRASKLKETIRGLRLFDANGRLLTTEPPTVTEGSLSAADWLHLRESTKPLSRYHPVAVWDELVHDNAKPETKEAAPLLEAVVPVHSRDGRQLLGAVQFLIDGGAVQTELDTLDRHLQRHAMLVFAIGGTVILLALGWAFRQLQRANDHLAERTRHLLRANHELALSAKTSALGAVSAHLIHGLKNPLFGLQSFVQRQRRDHPSQDGEWDTAAETAQRMQTLVSEVVRVLREENGDTGYELTLDELAGVIDAKMKPLAQAKQISWSIEVAAAATFSNRDANLILLIIENLTQNAIQAVAAGGRVGLSFQSSPTGVVCLVRDSGTGLPERVRANLFTPCNSAKPGGAGIGLAISKQLANHLGAELELVNTGPSGSLFALRLPEASHLRDEEEASRIFAARTNA